MTSNDVATPTPGHKLVLPGQMGARTMAHDWTKTALGPIETWSAARRTALQMIFASPFPMVLAWGPDALTFHNDAYLALLGRKPSALGRPFVEVWPEAQDVIHPLIERALAGEAVRFADAPFTLVRGEEPEEAYFDFTISPVRNETGSVAGILNIAIETTGRVCAERQLLESEARYRQIVEGAEDFACQSASKKDPLSACKRDPLHGAA